MLLLKVGNVFTDIEGILSPELYRKLQRKMSFRPKGYEFSTMYNRWIKDKDGNNVRRMWDGWRRQIWKRKNRNLPPIYFPTGLFSIVKDFLEKENLSYNSINCRVKPPRSLDLQLNPELIIRDYQDGIATNAVKLQRGIIQVPTGGGKTYIAAIIIQKLGLKSFIFFVTSIDLLTQAKESLEYALRLNGKPITVGQIGGGVIDIQNINVMTVQTAVRAAGKKWDSTYKFDADDSDDKTPLEQRKTDIHQLLKTTEGAIADECIDGKATVITRQGLVPIRELNKYIGKDILSFSDNSVVWKKMTHFYSKGKKKTLEITLENGDKIKCTEDHPIMTKQGWKLAKKIHHEDQILCYANVDVNKKFVLKEEVRANILNTSLDTKSENDQQKNGEKYLIRQQKQHQIVNAGARNKSSCTQGRLNPLSTEGAPLDIIDFVTDMTSAHQNGIYYCLNPKNKQYSEHFSETHLFPFLLQEAKTQDYVPIMGCVSLNGRNSNQTFLVDCLQNIGNTTIEGTENDPLRLGPAAIQKSREYTTLFFIKTKKESQNNGLMVLAKLDLHGGYVTTDQAEKAISKYTLKDSRKKKFVLLLNGSQKNTDPHQYMKQEGILLCILKKKQKIKLSPKSKSIFQIACNINYVKIKSIASSKEKDVFDITVEDTHCFFANNFLVHNCQHWRAETCQLVARSLKSAYYTYALSATPYRDEGDDLMIQACFGKKIAEINASQLIRDKWLIKPFIKIVHVHGPKSLFKQWQQLYKDQVTENEEYNKMIANIANSYIENGRLVLVLVQQIKHGKYLSSMIPGSIFLWGGSPKKKREENIKKLRNKEISCIVSTVIFDEGIDVRPLDTLILAGGGKSKVRAMQRIGRILRPFPGKETATAIDFRIHQKYLFEHSIAREKMYKTEEEFDIEEIDPGEQ